MNVLTEELVVPRSGELLHEVALIADPPCQLVYGALEFDGPFFLRIGESWSHMFIDDGDIRWTDGVVPAEEDCLTFDDVLFSAFGGQLDGFEIAEIFFRDSRLEVSSRLGVRIVVVEQKGEGKKIHRMSLEESCGLQLDPKQIPFP